MSDFSQLRCIKFNFGWNSAQDPHCSGGAVLPDLLAGFGKREGKQEREEEEGFRAVADSEFYNGGRTVEGEWSGDGAVPPPRKK